ncbi:MAG: hypothetical protein RLY31_335 [Bacteroidota bacterium]|jgi:hypothetical protein
MTQQRRRIAYPSPTEYGECYRSYVQRIGPEESILPCLRQGAREMTDLLRQIPAEGWSLRYAPGKWDIRTLVLHLIDGERVFAYRALRIARGDSTPLPGFDENAFAAECGAHLRSPASLLTEYRAVRRTTLLLFQSLPPHTLGRVGTASGHPASPRAIAHIIAGHERHHLASLRKRYLPLLRTS